MRFLTTFILLLSNLAFAQGLDRLVANNGFRSIKLNSDINNYKNFIIKNKDNAKLFTFFEESEYILVQDKNFDKIDNIDIQRIFSKTYENRIYEIKIVLKDDYRIIDFLKSAYGSNNLGDIRLGEIAWQKDNINCRLYFSTYNNKRNNNILIYTDLDLKRKAKKMNDFKEGHLL